MLASAVTIAIAIIGVYIVFALITSHITEAIGSVLQKRGAALYDGIVSLIGDGFAVAKAGGLDDKTARAQADKYEDALVKRMYDHPLITNLSDGKRKPSYIPTRAFTLSFLDEFRKLFVTDAHGIVQALPDITATPDVLLEDFVQRIKALPDGKLRQTLTTLLQTTDQEYNRVLLSIDALFDSSMQRISGMYKRWAAIVVAVVAAILVVLFNVDTLMIITQMANDQAKAQALAAAAQQLKSTTDISTDISTLLGYVPTLNLGWTSVSGWTTGTWAAKIAGLFISWFAVMLGAPFWFDVLQRLVPVRMTGDKPATASVQPADRDVRDVQSATRLSTDGTAVVSGVIAPHAVDH
jgi:hypothetical protein